MVSFLPLNSPTHPQHLAQAWKHPACSGNPYCWPKTTTFPGLQGPCSADQHHDPRPGPSGMRISPKVTAPLRKKDRKGVFLCLVVSYSQFSFCNKEEEKKNLIHRSRASPKHPLYSQPPAGHILPSEIPEAHFVGGKVKALRQSAAGGQRHPTYEEPRSPTFRDST